MTMFAFPTFIAIIKIKPCSLLQISLLPDEAAHRNTTKIAVAAGKVAQGVERASSALSIYVPHPVSLLGP